MHPRLSVDYNYRLICGQYTLHKGDSPVQAPMDEVALAIDTDSGALHTHGKPEMVREWVAQTQRKLGAGLFDLPPEEREIRQEMISALVVLQGRFELVELNKCLVISGYAGHLYRMAQEGRLCALDLLGRVLVPAGLRPPE